LRFEKSVEFQVTPEGLLPRPVYERVENDSQPRADWDEMFRAVLVEDDDDAPEFADWNQAGLTEFDEKE